VKDLRYAFRMLRRSPGFTLVALASLAIGIGANTAIFSLVNAVLLRPMPVDDPQALVAVYTTDDNNPGNLPVSDLNYRDWRAHTSVFVDMAAVSFSQVNVQLGSGEALQVPTQVVSGNYFDVIGLRMHAGRGFHPAEDAAPGAGAVAVISWPFWQRQLGGDPTAVGRVITINRTPFTIVGITPRTFTGTFALGAPAMWTPLSMHAVVQPQITWHGQRRGLFIFPFARLKPGVTLEQARENLKAVMTNLAHFTENKGRSATAVPLLEARVNPNGQGQLQALSRILLTVVGIVLVIACANLANLLMARASRRRREIAVRLAIGADRPRIVRQLLTESLLLSLSGGALGLGLANWLVRVLATTDGILPFPIDDVGLALDPRVLFFTLGVSMITGVLFGLAPALQASRTDVSGAIKQESLPGGDGRGWLRKSLVASQVALCVIALIAAGLFLRSLRETVQIDPGSETSGVATLTLNLGREGYDAERGIVFYRQLVERAMALPGAQAAAVTQSLPLNGTAFLRTVFLADTDTTARDRQLVPVNNISPGFFAATGIPILRGRDFTDGDAVGGPQVAIVNETMARQFFPNEDPVGRRFTFYGEDAPTEIVGVVKDSKVAGLAEDPTALIYEPIYQDYSSFASLMVRLASTSAAPPAALRALVTSLDSGMTVLDIGTLQDQVEGAVTGQRTLTIVVSLVGAVALLLASIGLYGVASYWVGMRTREIGVRMALGARPAGVLRLVLRQSIVVVAIGLGIGVVAAALTWIAGAELPAFLVNTRPGDLSTFIATTLVLSAVALAACPAPARRAARLDPLRALRQD
jgi:putative ABC transport system permease protein